MSQDQLANEVERARRQYDEYQARGCYAAAWTPFDETEAAYRSQQALATARLMREAGVKDLSGLRILDVGCGRGRHVRAFVDAGSRPGDVVGIDVHEPSVALARALSPQLAFSVFEGREIPFPDESFDLVTQHVVFSSIALEELRRQLAIEMVRVLRTGGYVLWWDTLRLSRVADDTQPPLDVDGLFAELPKQSVRVGQRPTLGQCARLPGPGRFLRNVLDRVPVLNYPATHVAALIGPKP